MLKAELDVILSKRLFDLFTFNHLHCKMLTTFTWTEELKRKDGSKIIEVPMAFPTTAGTLQDIIDGFIILW